MAFSLEAALVVPLVIGSCLGITLAGIPAIGRVCRAARLERQAIVCRMAGNRLYQAVCLRSGTAWTTGLQTSPQMILELASLIGDDCRLIGRNFPGLTAWDDAASGTLP
jgi:hypothetical protein